MEKYVSLEIAILLKDKNFNLKTHHYFGKHKYDKKYSEYSGYNDDYWGDNYYYDWNSNGEPFKPFFKNVYSRPDVYEVCDWFSEKYNIILIPTFSEFSRTYGYKIYHIINGKTTTINNMFKKDNSIYDALKDGIKYILTNLL